MVVRIFRRAPRLRTVIDHNLIRVELEAFARHVVAADLAVRRLHRPRTRLVVVVDVVAVERHARLPLRHLEHMRTVGNGDRPRDRIALHVVALKTARRKL